MKKIAFEEHLGTPETMRLRYEWLASKNIIISLPPEEIERTIDLSCNIELRIEKMDKCGIDKQVLFPGSIIMSAIDDVPKAIKIISDFNDYIYSVVQKYPSRFVPVATLPVQDPVASALELERAVTKLGMKGGHIVGYSNGNFIDEEKYYCLWSKAEELGVPLYLHPTETPTAATFLYKDHPELTGPSWSWGVDTGTYVLRMIFSGIFDMFPKTTLVVGHLGEMIPYMFWRLDNRWGINPEGSKNKKTPSTYFKENIYLTTSGSFSDTTLKCAIDAVGEDRVLFAVDYPYESNEEAVAFIENSTVSHAAIQKICYKNAEKLI